MSNEILTDAGAFEAAARKASRCSHKWQPIAAAERNGRSYWLGNQTKQGEGHWVETGRGGYWWWPGLPGKPTHFMPPFPLPEAGNDW